METKKGLVILHVDGLSYHYLEQALAQGRMPFTRALIEKEGYESQPYRCGLPSTTPAVQAGIIYGDNREIPSFRWWDKESGILVEFGEHSSFRRVAHKYFKGCDPLTRDGACIAACYPGAAAESFGLAYEEHTSLVPHRHNSAWHVLGSWAINPLNLADWAWRGAAQIFKANVRYWATRLQGRPAAKMYVISDLLEEMFLHQLTRYAVTRAMQEDYATIYAGFYAYDETAHAYGPEADHSMRILRHIDNTIRRVAVHRQAHKREYELVVLSDHGQVQTTPFHKKIGRRLADLVAEWLPTFEVQEYRGKKVTPAGALDGHIALTYSGGLAHLYFENLSWRLERRELESRFPGLLGKLAHAAGIGCVLVHDGAGDVLLSGDREIHFGDGTPLDQEAREFLSRFDEPNVIAAQLHQLNSFRRAGDIILFAAETDGGQVNFEEQVGGHGSLGGEQVHPFLLAKREWGLDTRRVVTASDVYPLLRGLKQRLAVEP